MAKSTFDRIPNPQHREVYSHLCKCEAEYIPEHVVEFHEEYIKGLHSFNGGQPTNSDLVLIWLFANRLKRAGFDEHPPFEQVKKKATKKKTPKKVMA